MAKLVRRWFLPLLYYTDNWISRTGLFLLLSSTVLWIFLTGASAASGYTGILQFVALPATFFAGLLLVPIGISMQRRGEKGEHRFHLPEKIELGNPRIRRLLIFVAIATTVNLVIGGALTYQTVHYMESANFCGTACHVMEPEHMAHQAGSHSQVKCVECHVGEGAGNALRAKVNGTRQLFLLVSGTYDRPIPAPPHALKPAEETCENCHRRDHNFGDRLWRRTQFGEQGERLETALLMKLGGAGGKGIHGAHAGIEYDAADVKREKILAVRVTRAGRTEEYAATGAGQAVFTRRMDCLDCHNRPAHEFEAPDRAVDRMMTDGRLPRVLPFFRKAALEALRTEYPTRTAAAQGVPRRLAEFYQKNHPAVLSAHRTELVQAGGELASLYLRNVFPEMKVTWGTYPKHLGHTDSPGCFRCHGDDLKSKASGKTITQDCETCHNVIGVEEKDLKIVLEPEG